MEFHGNVDVYTELLESLNGLGNSICFELWIPTMGLTVLAKSLSYKVCMTPWALWLIRKMEVTMQVKNNGNLFFGIFEELLCVRIIIWVAGWASLHH